MWNNLTATYRLPIRGAESDDHELRHEDDPTNKEWTSIKELEAWSGQSQALAPVFILASRSAILDRPLGGVSSVGTWIPAVNWLGGRVNYLDCNSMEGDDGTLEDHLKGTK